MKKSNNTNRYAIWIDKKKAMILKAGSDTETDYVEIASGNAERIRFKGEDTNKVGLFRTTLSQEKHMQEKANNENARFIQKVVAVIKHANAILILGSGTTRFDLQNALQKNKEVNGAWIENKAYKKISRRELELEMENHFNLHLG